MNRAVIPTHRRLLHPLIGIFLSLLLLLMPSTTNLTLRDNFNTPDNPSFLTLMDGNITYSGVGHKDITLMGGRYTLDIKGDLLRFTCYGSDVYFVSPVKPGSVFSVGCHLHFENKSSPRMYALLVGSKVEGPFQGGGSVYEIPSRAIYTLTAPFRRSGKDILGVLLLIGSLPALIKPITKPSRFLALGSAIIFGIPIGAGLASLSHILIASFIVGPSLRHGNTLEALGGIYMHLTLIYIYILLAIFGIYFFLSMGRWWAYVVEIAVFIAFISHTFTVWTILLLPIFGLLAAMLLPDIFREKHRWESYRWREM